MNTCTYRCLFLIATLLFGEGVIAQSTLSSTLSRVAKRTAANHLGGNSTAATSPAQLSRNIIERSLPAIREGGVSWMNDNDSLSCHRVSFQVWSLNRAAEFGIKSDSRQLQQWNDWATEWQNMVKPHQRDETSMEEALTSESDTMAQLLLGRPRVPTGTPEPEWVKTYCDHLLKAQQENGSWAPVGQLPQQKRPLRETQEVTTMWVQLALRDTDTSQAVLKSASAEAEQWMGTQTRGQSTEWWAARLMLARSEGRLAAANQLRETLLEQQREDGGWGWLVEDDSDALGTGIALYALARDGMLLQHESVHRAVDFLRKTQHENGTWDVRGTKVVDKDNVVDTSSYWGATWAVIGLLELHQNQERVNAAQPAKMVAQIRQVSQSNNEHRPLAGDEFEHKIRPLLKQYCIECHAPGEGQSINFLAALTATDVAAHRDAFASVAEQLQQREMPPKDFSQPSDADRNVMIDWLTKTLDLKPGDTDRIAPYVVEIFEDRRGNLWYGTMSKGVARYDGKTLEWFSAEDGLPSNAVPSFAEDQQGNLWVGTHGGIARFDGKKFITMGTAEGLPVLGRPGPMAWAGVQSDRDGNIWAGFSTGVFRLDGSRFTEFKVPIVKDKVTSYAITAGEVSLSMQDSQGNLWFGTDGYGALKFDGESFTRFSKKDGLCSNNVNRIVEDKQGNIWFACMQSYQPKMTGDGGVCRYDGKTFTKFPDTRGLSNNDIYTIYKTRSGDIWIGASGVGAYRYDGSTFTLFDQTDRMFFTRNFGVQDILEDRNGTMWFGFSGGLFRFDGQAFFNVTKDGPWEGNVAAMTTVATGGEVDGRLVHPDATAAMSLLSKGDFAQTRTLLEDLKRESPNEPSVQEFRLNQVGYHLIWAKRLDLAIQLFQLNTELYPQSFNTFDSLGEAYLRNGDEQLAIRSYEQSLKLNPDNTSARGEIRKLEAGKKYKNVLVASEGWLEEVLIVPPNFAPTMSLKGLEHLRLPPEFREPESDWFCSYLFAIDLTEPSELNEKLIAQQLLIYYRGLASGRRDRNGDPIDTEAFSIKPTTLKRPLAKDEFVYTLDWQEPFVNGSHQKMNLSVKLLTGRNEHGVVFICAAPQPFDSKVWSELLRVRTAFEATPIKSPRPGK